MLTLAEGQAEDKKNPFLVQQKQVRRQQEHKKALKELQVCAIFLPLELALFENPA
jgi:hypothetical protein